MGWFVRADSLITLRGCVDICRIPWKTFGNPLPRTASEFLLEAGIHPCPWMQLNVAYRNRNTEVMESEWPDQVFGGRIQSGFRTRTARITALLQADEHWAVRVRYQQIRATSMVSREQSTGLLLSHGLQYRCPWLRCECRVSFFDSDSYDARLYDCEGDVRGAMMSSPMYGQGSRWYLLCSWIPGPYLRVSGKYGIMLHEKGQPVRDAAVQAEIEL